MENLLITVSNYGVFAPMRTALQNNDLLTATIIGTFGIVSYITYLVETKKYGMPMVGDITTWPWILNQINLLCDFAVSIRFLWIHYSKYGLANAITLEHYLMLVFSFGCMISSEIVNKDCNKKYKFMLYHCLWHIIIYSMMDIYLVLYYY